MKIGMLCLLSALFAELLTPPRDHLLHAMNTAELKQNEARRETELLDLQLKIARRADELAHSRTGDDHQAMDWKCWFDAEREVLGHTSEAKVA